jgi:glycosyltransferase involved in cell wall biosynthesis
MALPFDKDMYPGKQKILFIGLPQSSHTHAWIDLLKDQEFNVRLFGLPTGMPPTAWKMKTYVTLPNKETRRNNIRKQLYLPGRGGSLQKKILGFFNVSQDEHHLARIIRNWKPDIVHTLGLDPSAYFYCAVRKKFNLEKIGKWVVQIRGGPDLTLNRLLPAYEEKIRAVFKECDQIIADNHLNYHYALEMGLAENRISKLGVVPGTGGIDILQAQKEEFVPPSLRERIILWPKAYESPASKALPVFEALELAWEKIKPCRIFMIAANQEILRWFQTLPAPIKEASKIKERVSRDEIIAYLAKARIMLAPSLVDGVPNILYEAMAYGAFPIVSPLATITPIVKKEENVLFARNLYPEEIAATLIRAMNDDELVDKAVQNNLRLVAAIADRKMIRAKVIQYYADILQDRASH